MSGLAAARALTERVDLLIREAGEWAPEAIAAKKALFGVFAEQWSDAEEAGDADALGVLEALRPRLGFKVSRQCLASRAFMYVRFVLTSLVVCWGCMCLLLVAPLRLLHPLLRACGVANGLLPVDVCLELWLRSVLAAAGVYIRLEGGPRERWGSTCGIIVYNHASNLDPFIVGCACRRLSPKHVGKKSLFKYPFFGWMCLALGMVPINRKDKMKAARTMNESVLGIMRRWGRSVAISPEGTRSSDGQLVLPFKKGAFHLQEHTRAPLLPLVIHGAYELWPPGQLFTATGEVTVRLLPEQPLEGKVASRETSRLALQRSLAKTLAQHAEVGPHPLSLGTALEILLHLLGTAVVFWQSLSMYSALADVVGLSVAGIASVILLATLVVGICVDKFD